MAKLYFYYSSMNAGKSASLLQSSYNYQERGLTTLLLCPALDDRYGQNKITSRIGISATAQAFDREEDLFERVTVANQTVTIDCVMIDEAQFLTKMQVHQLGRICDELDIPVLAYGLRTDFKPNPSRAANICWLGRIISKNSKRSVIVARKRPWFCAWMIKAAWLPRALKSPLVEMPNIFLSAANTIRRNRPGEHELNLLANNLPPKVR